MARLALWCRTRCHRRLPSSPPLACAPVPCSLFPPVYAQAIMFGQGLAGVTAGVAELIVMGAVSSVSDRRRWW